MTQFTTGGQRDVFKEFFEAVGVASERMQNIGQAFGEHLAGAGWVRGNESGAPRAVGERGFLTMASRWLSVRTCCVNSS